MALPRAILSIPAITLAGAYMYSKCLHQSFQNQIYDQSVDTLGTETSSHCGELENLPNDLLDNLQKFRIIHDRDKKKLPSSQVFQGDNAEEVFTKLVRRNMAAFGKVPQSWMMQMMAKHTSNENLSSNRISLRSIVEKETCSAGSIASSNAVVSMLKLPSSLRLGLETWRGAWFLRYIEETTMLSLGQIRCSGQKRSQGQSCLSTELPFDSCMR